MHSHNSDVRNFISTLVQRRQPASHQLSCLFDFITLVSVSVDTNIQMSITNPMRISSALHSANVIKGNVIKGCHLHQFNAINNELHIFLLLHAMLGLDQCCRTEQRTYLQRVRKHKYHNGNFLAQKITKPSKSKDLIAIYILHLLRDTFEPLDNQCLSHAVVIDLNFVLFYTKSFPINKFSVNLMKQRSIGLKICFSNRHFDRNRVFLA